MIRAVLLTAEKEFHLLFHDLVGLFMLVVAPIAVIAAAGFSLANVYAGSASNTRYVIAVADEDHGAVGRAVYDTLRRQNSIELIRAGNSLQARALVREKKRALVAIIVPSGTTAAFSSGRTARLVLYSDPVRYLQVAAVDLRLAEMCRRIDAEANRMAAESLAKRQAALRDQVATASRRLSTLAETEDVAARHERLQAERQIREQIKQAFARASIQVHSTIDRFFGKVAAELARDQAIRAQAIAELEQFFARLKASQAAFERWINQLRAMAGSRASQIPPPPSFPAPPLNDLVQAARTPPPDLDKLRAELASQLVLTPPDPNAFELPAIPRQPKIATIAPAAFSAPIILPGTIGLEERDLDNHPIGLATGFNTFDLQVPGFGITFLLIGMLMGISLALIDEHGWGTLDRLRSVAAPFSASIIGKLVARFLVGFVQLVVLFVAGRLLFGISLGPEPLALLLPTASIAFAGAAFGLMVAGAGSRDAVLPVGALVIMTIAAIGGCWWPIDFEPPWMRVMALAVPTTWTMQAYNDLMIRGLPAASAVAPSLINAAFGLLYLVIGMWIVRRRFG